MATTAQIKLSYFDNSYPDEGDFTLVYSLSESKQAFQHKLPVTFWHELRDTLDFVIENKEIKTEWHKLRTNGYCSLDRCCCGDCCGQCCGDCCNGCCTMNCCRFCCCNGDCHCCYGNCKSCFNFRDYYLGGVVLVVFGVFFFWSYLWPNLLGVISLISGAIMIENHSYSNALKNEWRDKVISLLIQNVPTLANKYGVQFTMSKYGFFGVIIGIELTGQVKQPQSVMLMVQPQTATATTAPGQSQPYMQVASAPQQPQAPPSYNASAYDAPPAYGAQKEAVTEGANTFQ